MGIQNPQTISLNLPKNPITNVLSSDYAAANPSYVLGAGRFSPAKYPMRLNYPRPDSETSQYAYHRIWQTGEPIEIPVEAQFGARPYSYKILSAPAGWSIGEFLTTDELGDLTAGDSYGTLSNTNPTAGDHTIAVGIWSADGNEFVRAVFTINFGNHGFFAAPANTGNGSGSDANNCMAFATAYGADDTISPAKNKILYCRGGNYTLTNIPAAGVDKPRAVVNYRSETPRFISSVLDGQINLKSSDLMFKGIEFVNFGESAVLRTYGTYYERQAVWRCKIVDAFGNAAQAKNEAGWFVDRASGTKRPDFLFREIEFVNCHEVAGFDWYEVSGVITRQKWTTNKTTIEEPIWYPKAGCSVDISFLTFDNPTTIFDSSVIGAINIGNNEVYTSGTAHVRFCFIRTESNANAIVFNTSINASSVDNWIDHVTLVGGKFVAKNYNGDDMVFVDRCVIQNTAGAVLMPEGGGATVTNTLAATSGLVDASGRLLIASNVGLYGSTVRA